MRKGEVNKDEAREKTAGTHGRERNVWGGGTGTRDAAGKGCGEV